MRPLAYGILFLLFSAARAAAADCADPAKTWLIGNWSMEKQLLSIRQEGGRLVWRYDREPGLVTARWGVKATAVAEGTVNLVRGCEIELQGHYTQYGGTPRAVGSPMEYRLHFDGVALAGSGLGWGKERFAVRWRKAS